MQERVQSCDHDHQATGQGMDIVHGQDPFSLVHSQTGELQTAIRRRTRRTPLPTLKAVERSGYAHYHLNINPSSYPQGVVVKVKASVTHAGTTKAASTWFKPNYD